MTRNIKFFNKSKKRPGKTGKSNMNLKSKLMKKNFNDAYDLLNYKSMAWIFLITTFMLQLISLSTTYAGSKTYFGGINLPFGLSAPLLFAISIQLTVFVLGNSIKRNFRFWTALILFLAVICSTYFSYIGIYNYINSPIEYLEERYTLIKDNIEKTYKENREESLEKMRGSIYSITSKIQKEYGILEADVQNTKDILNTVKNVKKENNIVQSNISSVKKPDINDYSKDELDSYYDAMAAYNKAIATMASTTASANSEASNAVYSETIKGILGDNDLEAVVKKNNSQKSNKLLLESAIDASFKKIEPSQPPSDITYSEKLQTIGDYCINFINRGGDSTLFQEIISKLYVTFDQVTPIGIPQDFQKNLNVIIKTSNTEETLLRPLAQIEKEVYMEKNIEYQESEDIFLSLTDALILQSKIHRELKNAAYKNNMLFNKKIVLTSEEYTLENLYILPISTLIREGEKRSVAWFCLGFAALIDGLTILFALMQKKKNKVLLAKRNKHITENNEELTENVILSAFTMKEIPKGITGIHEGVLYHIMRFTSSFKIWNSAENTGFGMYAPLNKLLDYENLLAVLRQLNLCKIISEEEFMIINGHEELEDETYEEADTSYREVAATLEKDSSQSYVMLKTKFIIWANDKFAEIGNEKPFANILDEFQNRGIK